MAQEGRQLGLGFQRGPANYARGDFVEGAVNSGVLAMADSWASSPEKFIAICGPHGAGKTHLAAIVFQSAPGGVWMDGDKLSDIGGAAFVVVDNVDRCEDPKALFNVIEQCLLSGAKLVLVGSGGPGDWSGGLKDLRTRLEAMARICLHEPDEDLMTAVIEKGFRDRQITVDTAVCAFAAVRLQRRFAAAHAFVDAADAVSFEMKKPVNRNLAAKVINGLFA